MDLKTIDVLLQASRSPAAVLFTDNSFDAVFNKTITNITIFLLYVIKYSRNDV